MADSPSTSTPITPEKSNDNARMRPNRRSPSRTPRWVIVFLIVGIALALLFVILHLTGNGFGDHMHMSTTEHLVQPL